MSKKLNANQWSQYWSKGSLTTFVGNFDRGYDGDLKNFWISIFERFVVDERVLDLGTGNGALIELIATFAEDTRKTFMVTGLDYADIEHLKDKTYSRISTKFYPNTCIENTGLEANSYDHIISQFGFEYSDLEKSIPEIARILRSKGTLTLVMHSLDSSLISESAEHLKQVNYCLDSKSIECSKELLPIIERIKSNQRVDAKDRELAEQLRTNLNSKISDILEYANKFKDQEFFREFVDQLSKAFRLEGKDKYSLLDTLKDTSIQYALRMQDMQSACMTNERLELLSSLFEEHFIQVKKQEKFFYKKKCYGLALQAIKK